MSEGIPAGAAKLASLHGVTLIEREDDFLCTSDKLSGQEFEGATPASALNAALKALGVEDRFDPSLKVPSADLPGPTKAQAKAAEKAIGHAPGNTPKPKAKAKEKPLTKSEQAALRAATERAIEQESGEVVDLAAKRAEKKSKPVTKGKPQAEAAPAAKPEPAAKPKEKKAAAPKTPKVKAAKKERLDGPDNGNGRRRGTRWFLKEIVLKDPALGNDDILAQLAKQGIKSTAPSVGSIRLDFMATLRAAKGINKLTDQVAKRVPDAKANARKSTAVLKTINEIIIEHPDYDLNQIKEALKGKVDKAVLQTTGVAGLSATRAAIIESLTVMREGKALR
jgi:hypothetical protein